jgi:GH24 family phage-related lysozyme (muramidase)
MPYQKSGKGCRDIIEEFEQGPEGGPALEAYLDEGGVPTIGLGHTRNVFMGMKIDIKEVDQLLESDLRIVESFINTRIIRPLNSNQFDALTSLIFNVGTGKKTGIGGETLAMLNDSTVSIEQIADRFYRIGPDDKEHGFIFDPYPVKNAGLIRRRQAEKALFLKPIMKASNLYNKTLEELVDDANINPKMRTP